jgi:hypothetical protein
MVRDYPSPSVFSYEFKILCTYCQSFPEKRLGYTSQNHTYPSRQSWFVKTANQKVRDVLLDLESKHILNQKKKGILRK